MSKSKKDLLILFQIYLNEKGLITSHDWDFENEAKKFLKKRNDKTIQN